MGNDPLEHNKFTYQQEKDARDHKYRVSRYLRDSILKFYTYFVVIALTTLSLSSQYLIKTKHSYILWFEVVSMIFLLLAGLGGLFILYKMIKTAFNSEVLDDLDRYMVLIGIFYGVGFILQIICRSCAILLS